jgi:hypothetical protein
MKFKVGDRVAVYQYNLAYYQHTEKGTIIELVGECAVKVELDKYPNTYDNIVVHHKQCRRLVKKKKERKFTTNKEFVDLVFKLEERVRDLEENINVFSFNNSKIDDLELQSKYLYTFCRDIEKRIMDDPTKHNK